LSHQSHQYLPNVIVPYARIQSVTDDQIAVDLLNTYFVQNKLEHLKPNKATGPDAIYPRVLIETSSVIAAPLCTICQRSLDEGEVPDDWKLGNITPICKKGPCDAVCNYRPVSVTSQVGDGK
jgi:hypothetical protein